MKQFSGKAISPGYATGTAFVYTPCHIDQFPRHRIARGDIGEELRRFFDAIDKSFRELKQLENRVLTELGEAQSAIFAAHLGLLKDRSFTERIEERIRHDLVNVEQALDWEVADLCQMLSSVENEYIRERADDIRDVGMRVMRQLMEQDAGHYVDLPPDTVIVAHELLPSETLDLDREHVVGVVTERGGENSHAAILARALGIPAVTGIANATTSVPTGTTVLVDGENGTISLAPSEAALTEFHTRKTLYDDESAIALAAESLDCKTKDGTSVSLLANINRPHECRLVDEHSLSGVGLFRTEFMFLEAQVPPSFQQQVAQYRESIQYLGDLPIVMRTLDLGGDKLPAFLTPHQDSNPNLGLRGLRFSLAERKLFETQIRAVLTAMQGHDSVRLLLPMVLGADDLADAVQIIKELSAEIKLERPPEIGAMIETPSSLFVLDEIFQIADFVCIGTNDLTQFMLAADRNAHDLAQDYSVLYPSILRAISQVVEAGRKAGREVSVCGEAASYPRTACLLVGLGVRQLSMSPLRAARVRYLLRETHIEELQALAKRALHGKSPADVRRLLDGLPTFRDLKSDGQCVAT